MALLRSEVGGLRVQCASLLERVNASPDISALAHAVRVQGLAVSRVDRAMSEMTGNVADLQRAHHTRHPNGTPLAEDIPLGQFELEGRLDALRGELERQRVGDKLTYENRLQGLERDVQTLQRFLLEFWGAWSV